MLIINVNDLCVEDHGALSAYYGRYLYEDEIIELYEWEWIEDNIFVLDDIVAFKIVRNYGYEEALEIAEEYNLHPYDQIRIVAKRIILKVIRENVKEDGRAIPYEAYEYKYEKKSYSPSNPWDAPGMKKSDFI